MKKLFRNMLSTILILALSSTIFTSCNNSVSVPSAPDNKSSQTDTAPKSGEKTTIQFWNSFTGPDGDILRSIVDNYNKTNTDNITVEMDIMPGANLNEKLAPAIATNSGPALVAQMNSQVAMYGQSGNMLPVDDFFDATGCDKSDFAPASLEGLQYEGKQIMIPMQWFTTYVYWNKDLFKKAGLDPEVGPSSWQDIQDMAAKITDPSKKVYGVGLCSSGGAPWFEALFLANGGNFVDPNTKKSILDSPENLASLEFIQNMADKGYTPKSSTGADLDNLMLADQLGIYINGPWLVSGLKDNDINFGVTNMPTGKKEQAGIAEISGFCIPKGTSDVQKSAAYKFIAYWNTTAVCKEWSLKNGFPPYLKSVSADSEVKSNNIVSTFSQMSNYAQTFLPGFTTSSKITSDILFPMVENVMADNDPQTELTKASQSIDKLNGIN